MKPRRAAATVVVRVETRLLLTPEAAGFLRVAEQTMRHWRVKGVGPRYADYGGVITYSVADLEAFRDRHLRISTSDSKPEEDGAAPSGPSL